MNNNIHKLTILRGLYGDKIFAALRAAKECRAEVHDLSPYGGFLNELYSNGAETDLTAYICNAILYDENAFSLCCANGKEPSKFLIKAYLHDVKLVLSYVAEDNCAAGEYYAVGAPTALFSLADGDEALIFRLKEFYKRYGCGEFIKYRAFAYDGGKLIPVENPSAVTLPQLKGYVSEKAAIDANIVNFLSGLPYGNMLLYGDRGTGKSSTIHAMLNKYWQDGLRIVEMNKENMLDLPKIRQKLISNPLKFIIFIDDLSLNESDDKISGLKAALEGSVSGNTSNTMIVATSNRRHIIKENFSDRENSVHFNDSIQEQLSLSDRFGITVLFSSTDKEQYLGIIKSLAADEGLTADDELLALAERWALVKGGRSPRRARQFIDLAISCKKRNTDIEF